MNLLPGWEQRLAEAAVTSMEAEDRRLASLPKSPHFYAHHLHFVDTAKQVRDLVSFAQQRSLAWVGFDTEYRYTSPALKLSPHQVFQDPRSVQPLLLSLALAEPGVDNKTPLFVFVVDLRPDSGIEELRPLFALPIPFVAHHLKAELFCLWQRSLPEPTQVWDTMIHEKILFLGHHHKHYQLPHRADEAAQAEAGRQAKAQAAFGYSLLATCQRYGLRHRFEAAKTRLQRSFLEHSSASTFSTEQIQYAAEDAIIAAQLYPLQMLKATTHGLLHHLITVEMPWCVTNARMEWQGFRVAEQKRDIAQQLAQTVADQLRGQLAALGLDNPNSHPQLITFFQRQGLLPQFRQGRRYRFDKAQLRRLRGQHPAIDLLNELRQAEEIATEALLSPALVGKDRRVHPTHTQLGTHTGRQTSQCPNILGLAKLLRPLVVPAPGYALGEADWSQVEVGIAAAVYGDSYLIELYNTGDVYSAMAQRFFWDRLATEDQLLPSSEFKHRFPDLRAQMKTCTLGILYGLTPQGLAEQLNVAQHEAKAVLKQFLGLFPALCQTQQVAIEVGTLRGYATTMSGLRRFRAKHGTPTSWERNWLINHPVQGSAAVVFKIAGNRLDKLYPALGAKLIIALHDAFIFEAPSDRLEKVATLTEEVMCQALQECFPSLQPRVEVNIQHTHCWNKDGQTEGLWHWAERCLQRFSGGISALKAALNSLDSEG